MEVTPGYKQTEVGVIPVEWEVKSLGKCLAGRPSYGINAAAVPYSDNLPVYVRITDISEDGRFSPDRLVSVKSELSGNYYLSDGDIVFARTGASVGKSYRYDPNDGPLVFAGFLIRARPDVEKLLPDFAAAYVTTGNYWRWVRLMSMRSGQPGINGNEYSQLPIPIPPLPEQRAIATALSDVDGLLGGLDRLIAKKRDLKQAAMQQLLTGQTRLPGFHGEWEVKRLDEVADVIDPHPSHRAPDEVSNGVPFVGIGDLDESGSIVGTKLRNVDRSVLIEHAARYNLNDQLIGLGRVASIGKVVCLKPLADGYAISPTLGIIRGRTAKRGYLLYALRSKFITEQFTRIMSGSTRSSVGMEVLRKLNVSLPPLPEEQTAIAELLTEMDAELAGLEQRRDKTRALKQAMMQELLTGRTRLVR